LTACSSPLIEVNPVQSTGCEWVRPFYVVPATNTAWLIGEYGLPPAVLESPEWLALQERFKDDQGDAGMVLRFLAVPHPEIHRDREDNDGNNQVYVRMCGESAPALPGEQPIAFAPAVPQ
jgi:hypothetical protein